MILDQDFVMRRANRKTGRAFSFYSNSNESCVFSLAGVWSYLIGLVFKNLTLRNNDCNNGVDFSHLHLFAEHLKASINTLKYRSETPEVAL